MPEADSWPTHGVPEAPCVRPKYYTQTVAITSKPEIPHSTFLIPAARSLSWAPHEEPLLERKGSCVCLTLCLSVCLSVPPSLRLYKSHCHSLRLWLLLRLSSYFSLCWFIFITVPPFLHNASSAALPLTFSSICLFLLCLLHSSFFLSVHLPLSLQIFMLRFSHMLDIDLWP